MTTDHQRAREVEALAAALPSWRPTASRDALVRFLWEVTEGPSAIRREERIAAFDNDGTLMCEKPYSALAAFLIAEHHGAPVAVDDTHKVLREVGTLFDGVTVTEYDHRVRSFLADSTHPDLGRPYPQLVYRPMQQLLGLLYRLHFTVFVCSDSSRDFVRTFAPSVYDVPRECVIGSEVTVELRDGHLTRTASPVLLDDGAGKVVHLWDRVGRPPLLAAGNAKGDVEMLHTARMALVMRHDDPVREYDYVDDTALAAAAAGGWTVLSMRDDFATLWNPRENG